MNLDTGYIVNSNSVVKTTNGGISWSTSLHANLYNTLLYDVYFINKNTGFTIGENGIIIKTTNGGSPIGIHNISENIPNKSLLFQNYPNPFNPATNIKFDIPKSTFVKLVIYDLLGREAAVLVNEQLKAGSYKADWDASAYPSGVYFYKLSTGEYTETKKMVLIK